MLKAHTSPYLKGSEYQVHSVMLGYVIYGQKKAGKIPAPPYYFYGSIDKLADKVAICERQVWKVIKKLLAAGWLKLYKKGLRRGYDRQEPNTYEVITAEEWLLTHTPPSTGKVEANCLKGARLKEEEAIRGIRDFLQAPGGLERALKEWPTARHQSALSVAPECTLSSMPECTPVPCQSAPQFRARVHPSSVPECTPVQPILEKHLRESTHTHTPNENGECVCVENLKPSAKAIDENHEVAQLQAGFQKRNGEQPAQFFTPAERRDVIKKLNANGVEIFRAVRDAWLDAGNWNSRTTNPFMFFVNAFDGMAVRIKDKLAEDAKKEEERKAAYAFARQSHAEEWNLDENGKVKGATDADDLVSFLSED